MKKAEAEFNTFQAMADKGTILAPSASTARCRPRLARPTRPASRRWRSRRATWAAGRATLPAQRAQLQQIDALIAQQGRTPELDKRRTQVEKVLNGSLQDLERDPARRPGARRHH